MKLLKILHQFTVRMLVEGVTVTETGLTANHCTQHPSRLLPTGQPVFTANIWLRMTEVDRSSWQKY